MVLTTNEENAYQRAQIDPEYRAQRCAEVLKVAQERRRVAEAAGYRYKSMKEIANAVG